VRCPVPYAIVALFGWGLLDLVAERAHGLVRRWRAVPAGGPASLLASTDTPGGEAPPLALSERLEV